MSSVHYDLGKLFGLGQKAPGDLYNLQQIGPDMGWTITDFANVFYAYYDVLKNDLGWSDSEILDLTFPTACINEVGYRTPDPAEKLTAFSIYVPGGHHYYNSELRVGKATIWGDGPVYNYGKGGTLLHLTLTGWKSVYGAGQAGTYLGLVPYCYPGEDGTATDPVCFGAGGEWCHGFVVRDLIMAGTTFPDEFNDGTRREAGIMYFSPGENSGVFNVRCDAFNDFGLLVDGYPAPARVRDYTGFYNKVACIGIRGCANGNINLDFSGDFNPWAVYVFRGGEETTAPDGVGPFWPCYVSNNPGGTIKLNVTNKLEGWAARDGYVSAAANAMSAPYPATLFVDGNIYTVIGKGMRLARLTGRFTFSCDGPTLYMANGIGDSLVTVIDDFAQTGGATNNPGVDGIPLDNSSVNLTNCYIESFAHWLHDVNNDVKVIYDAAYPSGVGNRKNMYWQHGSGVAARDAFVGFNFATQAATYKGIQPFINQNQLVGPGAVLAWNHAAAPTFNYNEVTGQAYP